MRFEIETPEIDQDTEPVLHLSLKKDASGGVSLLGEDAKGLVWYLVTLTKNGSLVHRDCIGAKGLQVDGKGRILLEKEEAE